MAGNSFAKVAAALGAGYVGYLKGQQMERQAANDREDREWVRQDRAREQAYRDDQGALINNSMQEINAAGDDQDGKRIALMKMYEQKGLLDAKYGKGSIGDMETVRKSVDEMRNEGYMHAYTELLQTGDPMVAADRFNKYGKKKIVRDSAQVFDVTDPITGQTVKGLRGQYEDGTAFSFNPLTEATRVGGYAGILQQAKDKAAKDEKRADTQTAYEQQMKVLKAQGDNAVRTAQIAAANGSGALDLERTKYSDVQKRQHELEDMQAQLAKAQDAGDEKRQKDLITQIRIKSGTYKGGGIDAKPEVRAGSDGSVTIVQPNGEIFTKGPMDKTLTRLEVPGAGGAAPQSQLRSGRTPSAGWQGPMPSGMKSFLGRNPQGLPVFLGNDGKQYVGS